MGDTVSAPADAGTKTVTDANGLVISYREMNPADMLDLLEAAGKESQNGGWVAYAITICSVTAIDGRMVPAPRTKDQVRALATRLGNVSYVALANAMFGPVPKADPDADPDAPPAPPVNPVVDTAKN